MTVDSEAIFALVEESSSRPAALEELHGSMAAAWLDERDRETLFLARGIGRPLWIGEGRRRALLRARRARRSSWWSATPAFGCASASSERERCSRSWTATARRTDVLRAGPELRRGFPPPARAGAGGGPLVPGPPGGDRDRRRGPLASGVVSSRSRTAAAEGRPSRPRVPRRRGGRPATRRGARGRSARARLQSARVGARPSRRASSTPCSRARSRRSARRGTAKPASRSAFESDPNLCQ